jgi:hypothetical protein
MAIALDNLPKWKQNLQRRFLMFEFEAEVQGGQIMIPDEYKPAMAATSTVKITLSRPPVEPLAKPNILYALMENPVAAPGWRQMTREEMHER